MEMNAGIKGRALAFVVATAVTLLPLEAVAEERAASVSNAVRTAPAAQARPNARGLNDDNPYFLPSVVLMGAGGLVSLYGMSHNTGVQCTSPGLVTFSCGTTKSKTTIFSGVGMIGAGVYLFYKGKARNYPQILAGPDAVSVRQRITW